LVHISPLFLALFLSIKTLSIATSARRHIFITPILHRIPTSLRLEDQRYSKREGTVIYSELQLRHFRLEKRKQEINKAEKQLQSQGHRRATVNIA
jgi:hypothetical protein